MLKKKIALVVDIENWAFDIEAKLLKKKLIDYYDIDVFCASNEKYNNDLYLILEDLKDYDLIHFFWRKLLIQLNNDELKNKLKENNIDYKNKLSTGIYDHLFVDEENINSYKNVFNEYVKSYYTCSKKLENIYNNISIYKKPWGTIHDTYDNNLYSGGDKLRYLNETNNDPLIIGWVGNSEWNIKYQDFKGFHSILTPVLDELISEGYKIEKNYADKNIIFRTNEEMPEYYGQIDVCVIVSTLEGTPRPIIEGMASGVALITTDVGIACEVLGPKQKEFILGSRDNGNNDEEIRRNLKEKIKLIYNNRDILRELSKENYEYAKNNDIDHLYLEYKKYFDNFFDK